MIKIGIKVVENVAILKLKEGSMDEIIKIEIGGIRGLGGFTIRETITYLFSTIESGVVAYNFKTDQEAQLFKRLLKENVKMLNGGVKGVYKLKYSVENK